MSPPVFHCEPRALTELHSFLLSVKCCECSCLAQHAEAGALHVCKPASAFSLRFKQHVFLPVMHCVSGERGPSVGKEWFWLRNNPKLDASHMLPDLAHFMSGSNADSSSSRLLSSGTWYAGHGGGSSSTKPWSLRSNMWWEEGWRLGAVCLYSWPAHKERLRSLAVDPWEHLIVTAGRLTVMISHHDS